MTFLLQFYFKKRKTFLNICKKMGQVPNATKRHCCRWNSRPILRQGCSTSRSRRRPKRGLRMQSASPKTWPITTRSNPLRRRVKKRSSRTRHKVNGTLFRRPGSRYRVSGSLSRSLSPLSHRWQPMCRPLLTLSHSPEHMYRPLLPLSYSPEPMYRPLLPILHSPEPMYRPPGASIS